MMLRDIDAVPLRRCRVCRELWPRDEEFYHPDRSGYRGVCRACWNEYQQRRYQQRRQA